MGKSVIINADDFGMSPLFNRAILDLMKNDNLKSTSVMMSRVNYDQKKDIDELKKYRDEKNVSVGLHIEYFDTRFEFHLERQLAGFIEVFGNNPDHIDLHAKTYFEDGYSHIVEMALGLGIPCRNYQQFTDGYKGLRKADYRFSGSRKNLQDCLDSIAMVDGGTIEIVFHPGYEDKWYITGMKKERQDDIEKCKGIAQFCVGNDIFLLSYKDV